MKTILIYSGGLDSTVLLYNLINLKHNIIAISFNYGQKHKKELLSAIYFCNKLNIRHEIIDLSSITNLISNSCLTSSTKVPEGYYTDESMKKTVVPNRNMIMLSIAAGFAINEGYNNVAFAVHNGDHTIYPDCRQEFVTSLDKSCKLGNWHQINILSPFVNINKQDIVLLGNSLNIELEKTWSCYNGLEYHCGKCGTCVERIESFKLSGITDNTIYKI